MTLEQLEKKLPQKQIVFSNRKNINHKITPALDKAYMDATKMLFEAGHITMTKEILMETALREWIDFD